MAKTHKSTWKAFERKIAKLMGGARVGCTGHSAVDVQHPRYEIECKLRQKLAIASWFEQVKKHSDKSGKIPLLMCRQKHKHTVFVTMRMEDFLALERGQK